MLVDEVAPDRYRYGPEGKRYRKEEGNRTMYICTKGTISCTRKGTKGVAGVSAG